MRGIYKITNKINGKIYIGESLNIERRWKEHLLDLSFKTHKNYKLQNDYNKYGYEAFEFEVIATLDKNISSFIDKFINIIFEDVYITKYNSIEEGYNIERTLDKVLSGEKIMFNSKKSSKGVLKGYLNKYRDGLIFIKDSVIYYYQAKKDNGTKEVYLSNLPTIKEVVTEDLKLDIKPKELKKLLYDNDVLTFDGVRSRYKKCFVIVKHNGKNILKVTPKGRNLLQYLITNKTLKGFKK